MANIIKLKRGLITDIEAAVLKEGELALAFDAGKTKVQAWVGTSTGTSGGTDKLLVNPDVTVPTKVSDLTNDSGFQTSAEVASAIAAAVAGLGTASFRKVNAVPTAAEAEDNVLYLVMNSTTNHYDIYAKVDNEVVLLDDTTVDLSDYVTTTQLNTALAGYVEKVTGKGLSTEDYTTAEKTKLAGIASGAEVNVQADWSVTDTTSDAYIANKPTLGAAAAKGVVTTVDNSDNLPTSGAVKTGLDGKMDVAVEIDGGTF